MNKFNEIMDRFSEKLQKFLAPLARFTGTNKYFNALRDAFVIQTGLLIAGSFALVLNIWICGGSGLAGKPGLEWLANNSNVFSTINYVGVSCISLYTVMILGYQIGKADGQKPFITMLLAVSCFLIMLDPSNVGGNLGAQYLFLSFFVAFGSVGLYNLLMKNEKIKIKMPAGVPPMVADSFNGLIPTLIVLFLFGTIAGVIFANWGLYANDIIYKFIQLPFSNIVESYFGWLLITVLAQLLWWLGIHGNNALRAISSPIATAGLAENAELVAAGLTPTHWYTINFSHLFTSLGGSGQVIGLALAILLFSKRKDHRQITKVSMPTVLCGIDEPLVFGLPIMLNPTFLIPFIVSPVVCGTIGYFACKTGFLQNAFIRSVSGMPMFIQQWLGWNGQLSAMILLVVVIVVSTLIYAPFVLVANREKVEEDIED